MKISISIRVGLAMNCAAVLVGQSQQPVVVRREPPAQNAPVPPSKAAGTPAPKGGRTSGPKALPKAAVPSPKEFPFAKIQEGLVNPNAEVPIPNGGQVGATSNNGVPVTPPQISKNALDALTVNEPWVRASVSPPPAPGKDGRVLYTYGAGLPTIICAPLRVCILELQPGEKIIGEPHIGDSVRWSISPALTGMGEGAISMVVIKPKEANLDTNLFVPTDRRAYHVRLVSSSGVYLARVAFSYPEDETLAWKQHLQKQADDRRRDEFADQITPLDNLDKLYFDYRIVGGDEHIRPIKVVDDGKKTFIQMSPSTTVREAPILAVVGPDGAEMVNYRVKGDMYIVDRLFERGALILGAGKKARRAEIIRGTYRDSKGRALPFGKKSDPFEKFTTGGVKPPAAATLGAQGEQGTPESKKAIEGEKQ